MQGTQLLERLESQMFADVVRVGLSGVLKQQSTMRPSELCTKSMDLFDQLKSTKGWISVSRVAGLVYAHPQTVRNWISHEGLPAQKFRGRWKIYGPSAAEWLESKLTTSPPANRTTNSAERKIASKDCPMGASILFQEAKIE